MEVTKDSGIDYIGLIPDNWIRIKIKYLATEKESIFIDGDWIESDIITESGIRYLTTGNVGVGNYKEQGSGYISEDTFRELNCLKVLPGDLMISRLNEPIGRACIVPDREKYYVVAVDNVIIRSDKKHCNRYLMYIMNTNGYAETGNMIARGSTMSRISRTQLGNMWVVSPPLQEQQSIASFLDEKCLKIDNIISDLEKEIEILEKYKKSLITETVTKGLDKNVPMKDSGVDWIGEIPEHWEVKRLKYISDKIGSGKTPLGGSEIYEDTGIIFIRSQNVYDTGLHKKDIKFINKYIHKEMRSSQVELNDILLNITGASIGRSCMYTLSAEANVNQHVCIIRLNKMNNARYIQYVIISDIGKIQVAINQMGGNRDSLTFEQIGNFNVPLPQNKEQQQIVDFLDNKCTEISSTISTKEKQLETIRKYKQSLIYEYVTGKKRVKGFGGKKDGN